MWVVMQGTLQENCVLLYVHWGQGQRKHAVTGRVGREGRRVGGRGIERLSNRNGQTVFW